MRDLIGVALLFGILIVALAVVARYAFLAWFQAGELQQIVRQGWPAWQRKLPIFRSVWKWIDSPIYVPLVRVTTAAALLFCIFLLALAARPMALTVIHAFSR